MGRMLVLAAVIVLSPGCLVLNVHPLYDDQSLTWEPALLGSWLNAEDGASLDVRKGEWKSYTIRYAHPTESGTVTGYLTAIAGSRYLDVMPARGEDRGTFLVPVHLFVRIQLQGDRLELAPVSYDWMADRLKTGDRIAGLDVAFDQREQALILSPTRLLRTWLADQGEARAAFGAVATFTRIRPAPADRSD